ncbi:MAG: nicotinamide riboside transporter PnuC [Clostridiales bacterium]|nr:nicotinamide riboside transporter PnuC [Clostridiales bacterium]
MLTDWKKYKTLLPYAAVFLTAAAAFIIFGSDPLSFVYAALSVAAIYLNSRRLREGLLFFAASVGLYVYISFQNRFYGESVLNVLFFAYYIFSFFRWQKASGDNKILSVKKRLVIYILMSGIVFIPLYMLLLRVFKTEKIFLNSLSTFLNCVAVIFTVKRIFQQYLVWLAINAVQIALWLSTLQGRSAAYLPILILNLFFLGINIYNYLNWKKMYALQAKNAAG